MDLHAEQERIEQQMRGLTEAKALDIIQEQKEKGTESSSYYGASMMKRAIEPLSARISEWMRDATSGKAGRKHLAVKYLEQVKVEVAAFATAKVALDQITTGVQLQSAALAVGKMLEDEVRFADFQKKEPKLRQWIETKYKNTDPRVKRKALIRYYNRHVEDWAGWPVSDRLHLGSLLIDLFIETTKFAEITTVFEGNKSFLYLSATREVMEWVHKTRENAALLRPVYLPMVVPPMEWDGSVGGGYMTTAVRPLRLVKTRNKAYLNELDSAHMPEVFDAINAIQKVSWEINHDVLGVMEELWDRGQCIAGLPPAEPVPLPLSPVPRDMDKKDMDETQLHDLKMWKRTVAGLYEYNVKLKSRRLQAAKSLSIAQEFARYSAIYFPHTFDFRGRAYAVPMFLQPQGTDQAKGLLRFADGKALGDEEAAGWLAIQGANTFGEDKLQLADRIGWVEDNSDAICEVAEDPMSNLWWAKADKPWQFLAFCFEWAGWIRDGVDHVTHIPIAMDGSCSGLQHFSAALRDRVGGAAVNLTNNDSPADVYQAVVDRAEEYLRLELTTGGENSELAALLLSFGLSRKAAKRATMTLPYGSTKYACRQFVLDWIREVTEARQEEDSTYESPLKDREIEARNLLSEYIWTAIGETVIAARGAMDWLRSCASILAKQELPVTWTTPDGFPVMQEYHDVSKRRVKTRFGDKLVYLTLVADIEDKLDDKAQANGLPPNWVHSMDANHLRTTVNAAIANGVTHMALVHDSFGTHATDAPILAACLRETFIQQYEDDQLKAFAAEAGQMIPSDGPTLPERPPMGDLDLNEVRESDYIFA